MADTKISELAAATTLTAVDILPIVQEGANKKATLGQLKLLANTPVVSVVSAGNIPTSTNAIISVSGACVLPVSTTNGTELKIISTAAGNITATNLLPSNGFSFAASGATLNIIWLSNVWNVLSVTGMTAGV